MRAVFVIALAAGCNFRIDGLLPSSGGDLAAPVSGDMAGAGTVDMASMMSMPDLTPAPDLAQMCSTSCAAACAPCCQESYSGSTDSTQTCPSGASCNCQFGCSGPNNCTIHCNASSTCTAAANNCNSAALDCQAGATCWLQCGNTVSNNCSVNYNGSASVRVDCGTNVNSCQINGCPTTVTNCPGNVKVCGRACP